MKITIEPRPFEYSNYQGWEAKLHGVVLVEKADDIEPLWQLLCAQDDYWESYQHLIKVAPTRLERLDELQRLCEYCGKTDIYDAESIRAKIPFLIYQYKE